MCCAVLSGFSHNWLFEAPETVARQAPLSMRFSRQEYWSGLPCPFPGDLPNPGIEPRLLHHVHWQTGSLPLVPPGFTSMPAFEKDRFVFKTNLRFIAKLNGRYNIPSTSCFHVATSCPSIKILHQSGTFVTIDEPILPLLLWPKSIVYIRVHSWLYIWWCFDKCIMACIYRYSTT